MKITLINPPLCGVKDDLHGNIPSLPLGLVYLAASVRGAGYTVEVIDGYGLAPKVRGDLTNRIQFWGLNINDILERVASDTDLIGISIHSIAGYTISKQLIAALKKKFNCALVVGGSCPTTLPDDFLAAGADYVVLSEGEESFLNLIQSLDKKVSPAGIDGLYFKGVPVKKERFIEDLDALKFPAFDLLPLENYWSLGYAHGPYKDRYLSLISSRGCPFECNFCASPKIWQRKWRFQSPQRVVDELQHHLKTYAVKNFQFQDDAFTTDINRVNAISREIIKRDLDITWSFPAGVKVETLNAAALKLMRQAGLKYLSVSPESGSKKVLSFMKKRVNYDHMNEVIKDADHLGIKTQACFVVGYPGEEKDDITASHMLLKRLMRSGLDEIVVPILTPLPGAPLYDEFKPDCSYEELSFSPAWRKDYKVLKSDRRRFYLLFFLYKIFYQPLKVVRSILNIITGNFETKSEMSIYRIFNQMKNSKLEIRNKSETRNLKQEFRV